MQNNIQTYTKQEIPALTGLRFFAAAFVCLAHTFPHVVPGLDPNGFNVSRLAAEGMTLFFVLSGFVIHYNYSASLSANPARGLYNFFISRFARLYPLYFLCLFLDITKHYGYSTLTKSFHDAIPFYLSMTQSWIYKPLGDHALIYQFGHMPSVSWSVSTEWFFYLAYPIICFAILKLMTLRSKLSMLALLTVLVPTLIFITAHLQPAINDYALNKYGEIATATHHQDSLYRWIIYFSPYSRITEFLVGCLTASIYMQVSARRPSIKEERIGLVVLLFGILAAITLHNFIYNPPKSIPSLQWISTLHMCFGFAIPLAIIIFCSARYKNFITRFLCHPTLLMGGEISYSLYLLHLPIGEAFSRDAAPVTSLIVGIADGTRYFIALLAILGAATISYRFIEVPARRFIRRHFMIKNTGLRPAITLTLEAGDELNKVNST
jgi:peptidoglycan/LPS O-acetylase OafA/YrhL